MSEWVSGWSGVGDTPQTVMTTKAPAVLKSKKKLTSVSFAFTYTYTLEN